MPRYIESPREMFRNKHLGQGNLCTRQQSLLVTMENPLRTEWVPVALETKLHGDGSRTTSVITRAAKTNRH